MKHIHLIGIGGTGLSAIARVLLETGYMVSGSDRVESPFTSDLQSAGAVIYSGHLPGNVRGADLVVRSSAIPDDNPEVIAAQSLRIPIMKRAEFLNRLMEGKLGIAVAGTHGKTTTASMIAWSLLSLGKDPTFIVGGILENLGVNARAGKGDTFVIEADEYDHMFLGLEPSIEVITNIEHDHPDCYPTPDDFQAAFIEFMQKLRPSGTLIACVDDPGACELIKEAQKAEKEVIGYTTKPLNESGLTEWAYAKEMGANELGGFTFVANIRGQETKVNLQIPGLHNVSNALAALTVAQLLGLPVSETAQVLSRFTGTRRRFEVRGEVNGIVVVDDYAHHPTEIRATLNAARTRYPTRRIWAVWQPHTYSRVQTLFNAFVNAFSEADEVIVTEIYAAREPKQAYSSKRIADALPHAAHFIADIEDASNFLLNKLKPGDVLLVLSAGDADRISTNVLAHLKEIHNG
jgi:UDP-N-acetylmuramate--alanine ligase